jgi:hypothetical protein
MVRAHVDGHSILAQLTEEAVDDSDFETCKAVAGQIILSALKAGRVPKLVVVKTTDLLRRPS